MASKAAIKSAEATEATPLWQRADADAGSPAILVGLCIAYALAILPVGVSSSMLPALEEDSTFEWTATTSGIYLFMSTWAVAVGCLTIGWLPDYFPNTVVMLGFVFVAGIMLCLMSFAQVAASFIAFHMVVFVLKALTWPAAMSIVGTHLAGTRPELGILMVGLASRLSSSGSSLLMGGLLLHMDWRHALQYIGGLLMVSAVTYRLLIRFGKMEHLMEMPARSPQVAAASSAEAAAEAGTADAAHTSSSSRIGDLLSYLKGLFQDSKFLLIITFAVGLEMSLGLSLYVGAFMHSIFRLRVAESAIYSGTMNIGEVLSLMLGIFLVMVGVSRRVIWNTVLVQMCLGICVSAGILVIDVSFQMFFTLGLILGFSTTLGGYLVAPLNCIELAKTRNSMDIAARVTIVDGISGVAGATTRLLLGMERGVDEHSGLNLSAAFCLIGTSIMLTSLYFLQRDPTEAPANLQQVD